MVYTPIVMTFRDIVGHGHIIDALIRSHHQGTGHHALLFSGPDGVGKEKVARAFIAFLNCVGDKPLNSEGKPIDACGQCRACRHFLGDEHEDDTALEHPDLIMLRPAAGKARIPIAQVRELLRIVPFPPIEVTVRIVLILPADALTTESANALLRTIEEPSSQTRFILISSRPEQLLATIRSRCQRIAFGPLASEDVQNVLIDRFEVDVCEAKRVTLIADGSVATALSLLEDPILAKKDELIRRLAAIKPGSATEAFALAEKFSEEKSAMNTVFELLQRFYRDLLLLRTGADGSSRLSYPELYDDILKPLSLRYGVQALLARLELIADTKTGIDQRNLNLRLSMERLMLALTAAPGREGIGPRQ
jgi:DNA polymerase-3 subunit delta'